MPISVDQAVSLWEERKKALAPVHAQMQQLQEAVNGDMDLPLPELERNERPMVANLIAQGLDQSAMRVASTVPDCRFPSMRPGVKVQDDLARDRRLAVMAWWKQNKLHLLQRKRARWLLGYATAPVVIRPDKKRGIPRWHERDPMTSYWPPGCDMTPPDMIFTFRRTLRWLRERYPSEAGALATNRTGPDTLFTILEYLDDQESFLVAVGDSRDDTNTYAAAAGPDRRTLLGGRVPNVTGMCMAVLPSRISLDRLQGQFDAAVPLFWSQAMMMALEVIAVKRGIFTDEWIMARPNESARVITEADGLRGVRGHLEGGVIQPMQINPGMQTYQTIDRIERSLRLAGGIPAEYGGESPNNIRTARRGAQVLSSSIDYVIQEAQDILAASLEEEDCRAIAVAKAYFPGRRSFYYSWNGKQARADYDPVETFETDEHSVRYAIPGASINELVIGGGQRIGMGALSTETWMTLDPLIEDAEMEMRRVDVEGLRRAAMSSLQTMAAGGQLPPPDAARIIQLRYKGQSIEDAILTVQKEAQERQASSGPEGAPDGPVAPGAPEAQPGIAVAGTGAEAPEAIAPPEASLGNLRQMLSNLRQPTRATPGG